MVDEYREQTESADDETQGDESGRKARFTDGIDTLVDEVNKVVRVAIVSGKTTAESIGENIRDTVQGVRSNRDNVVMVRVDDESLSSVDELVEAGIVNSRSEAAALLITEGIKSKQGMFERMAAKVEEIRRAKEDLRRMVQDDGYDLGSPDA